MPYTINQVQRRFRYNRIRGMQRSYRTYRGRGAANRYRMQRYIPIWYFRYGRYQRLRSSGYRRSRR